MSERERIVAGNWKLNHGPSATREFLADFLPRLPERIAGTVALFPPSISTTTARDALAARPDVRLGVQNVYWQDSGAFTGEISAPLAADAGATMALVGHSERRHVFGESDEATARKVAAVIAAGLTAVLCVGETIDERRGGTASEVVDRQLRAVFHGAAPPEPRFLVIAYEPVWAIGTGHTASPEDAAEMHAAVRTSLRELLGPDSEMIPVLYGGSVKVENAGSLLEAPGIDGLLVGGASLDPAGFARICSLLT